MKEGRKSVLNWWRQQDAWIDEPRQDASGWIPFFPLLLYLRDALMIALNGLLTTVWFYLLQFYFRLDITRVSFLGFFFVTMSHLTTVGKKTQRRIFFIWQLFCFKGTFTLFTRFGFIMFSMSLIMFTRHFCHLFANPRWIELNQTSIGSKLFSLCYVTLVPPYLVLNAVTPNQFRQH
jgi:hypothetical protein